jgi:hypothetical protein
MRWLAGILVLGGVGFLLRRLLWIHPKRPIAIPGLVPLSAERQAVYDGLAREIEARTAMLGVSLNDAFEERGAGRHEMAWRMIWLSASEWDSMVKIVAGLLNVLAKHLPNAQVVVTPRSIHAHRFKSKPMVDYVRMHELLDQLVFSSERRYQLQLRLLRRAAELVAEEFRRIYRHAEFADNGSSEVWNQIDLYFHDFDLIAKEALLALRALLSCLSLDFLPAFSADLDALLQQRVHPPSRALSP